MDNAIKFDYLEFTIFYESIHAALNRLHLCIEEFSPRTGRNGYKSGLVHNSGKLIVLYDGSEGMGCHFVFSGSCMDFFYSLVSRRIDRDGQLSLSFSSAHDNFASWYKQLRNEERIKISRLDIAFDCFSPSVSVDRTRELWAEGLVKTNWRSFERLESFSKVGVRSGVTDYYGSRKSEVFMRCYDKRLEQEALDLESWTRFEFVLRNKYATSFLDGFFESFDFDAYLRGLFNRYFNILDQDYLRELQLSSILAITLPEKKSKSIDSVLDWVREAVGPSLNTLIRFHYGGVDWLYELIVKSPPRRDEEFLFAASTPTQVIRE